MKADVRRFTKPILLLVGPPGTGKSTIGQRLSHDLKLPLFSTGTYLRSMVESKESTPLIQSIKASMLKGELIDSKLIVKVIANRLAEEEGTSSRAIIFDGCPRKRLEVEELLKVAPLQLALHLSSREDILLEKMSGRRECALCRRTYNFSRILRDGYDLQPLVPTRRDGNCDDCSGRLVAREDDNSIAIARRLSEYNHQTYPLIHEFYMKLGILQTIVMYRGQEEYSAIRDLVLRTLQHSPNAPSL